jgi:hypothetical protein
MDAGQLRRRLETVQQRYRWYAIVYWLRALPMLGVFAGLGVFIFRFGTSVGQGAWVTAIACFLLWRWAHNTCPPRLQALHQEHAMLSADYERLTGEKPIGLPTG